jgi:hypothetical protein
VTRFNRNKKGPKIAGYEGIQKGMGSGKGASFLEGQLLLSSDYGGH